MFVLNRLGTWQFMTNMPYTSLSSTMMWRLLWSLHQDDINQLEIKPGKDTKIDSYKWSLAGQNQKSATCLNFSHQIQIILFRGKIAVVFDAGWEIGKWCELSSDSHLFA